MNILRHIGLVIVLLIGFVSSAESALRPWEIFTPEEFSEHDRTLVQSLFTDNMEARGPGYIAHTFGRFPADQRDSIVESTLRLRTPNMTYEDISHLMEKISYWTDLSNRRLTVELVQQLIPIVGEEDKPWKHFQILQDLPTLDAKRNFVDFVCGCSLFTSSPPVQEESDNYHILLMRILCKSPNDQRESLVTCVGRICGPNAQSKEQEGVMNTLVKFSNNEDRDRFVTSVLKTDLLSLYEGDKHTVLSALQQISAEDKRKDVLEFLSNLGFISREISARDFYSLFTRFSWLSSVNRQRRWDFILRSDILTPTMSVSERVNVVNAINDSMLSANHPGGRAEEFNQRLINMAVSFMTPETTGDDRKEILLLLRYKEASWEQKELLVSYASQLCTPNMTSHDRLVILKALSKSIDDFLYPEVLQYRFQFASAYLQEATLQGIITQDNIFTWTYAFLEEALRVGPIWRGHRIEDGDDHSGRRLRAGVPINIVRGAAIQLGEQQANPTQDPRFGALPTNIDVVGQEAIIAQRRTIKETYETLATSEETATVISRNLPPLGTEDEVFVVQTTKLNRALEFLLKTQRLSAVQKGKLINALLGMNILTDQSDPVVVKKIRDLSPETQEMVDRLIGQGNDRQIPRHGASNVASYRRYSHPDLPNIRQFFALIYNLLDQQMGAPADTKGFTRSWLAETFANDPAAWDKFKRAFEYDFHIDLPGTVGEALEHEPLLETHLTSCLENLLKDEDLSETVTHKDLHKALQNLARSYGVALKERYTPLIEALAMIMRGHNGNLDSLEEQNRPACAEGAYLGIIKVLQEIPNVSHIVGTSLAHIDVVACGGGVRPAASDISAISLGAAQDTAEQARALREAQDAAYEASLAADHERDRLRVEQQQSSQAAAAAEETPVETPEERRARLAAAADARLTKK